MTAPPTPAEARLPAPSRRPLMTASFWVMIAFTALCLLAAAAVVVLGPRLGHMKRAVVAAAPAPAYAAPGAAAPAAEAPVETSAMAEAAASPDVAALSGRLQRLEGAQDKILGAAATALAVSALDDAAARPTPFAAELTTYARLLPGSPEVLALASLAQQGAPTRAALALDLTGSAAEASAAARAPADKASFMERMLYAISRVVTVRRIDTEGSGPDAVLARAVRRADDGDLEGAAALVDSLPAPAREALADWREKARRRIEIDRRLAALRAEAVAQLSVAQRPPA